MRPEPAERFWAKVTKGRGCWLWNASSDQDGYGVIWWCGRTQRAHRVAWELTHGDPAPPERRVVQSCANQGCVNPEHLVLTDPPKADNPLDRVGAIRARTVDGLGHIERRGANSFRLSVFKGRSPITGRREYERRSFRGTEEQARVALAELVVDVAAGVTLVGPDVTFGECLDLWFASLVPDLEESTAGRYSEYLAHVPDLMRAMPLRRLTVEHLEALYLDLRTKGNVRTGKSLAMKTVRGGVHMCIRRSLAYAKRRKWISVNPALEVEWGNRRKAKKERRRPTPTPIDKVRRVLVLAEKEHGSRFAVCLRVLAAAGGRRGEVHGLRWNRVQFDKDRILLSDNVVRSSAAGGWRVKLLPKDEEPRIVNLGSTTMRMLKALYDESFELGLACGIQLPDDAFVFSDDPDGSRHWIPRTTTQRFQRLCVKAGLPVTTRLHDLRSMMSTELLERGTPLQAVSARLGHAYNSSTFMTLDVYTGRNPELDRAAGELMDALLDDDLGLRGEPDS
jgi:integrase